MRGVRHLLAVGAVMALSACSFSLDVSLGGQELPPEDVESAISESLAEMFPDEPAPTIDCGTEPYDLKVGTELACTLTPAGTDVLYDVAVEVTSVDGRDFTVFYQVAETPRP